MQAFAYFLAQRVVMLELVSKIIFGKAFSELLTTLLDFLDPAAALLASWRLKLAAQFELTLRSRPLFLFFLRPLTAIIRFHIWHRIFELGLHSQNPVLVARVRGQRWLRAGWLLLI